ncbi:hypothetical protein PR202_ga18074 [Eleusine coracana subsp. coracana]|uniref:UBA domain-containing protein n=1 Tax=Eleusine coracana subsp. coracana TaxID=191504 RepID=A0AAV5CQT5_ELECO|nr:hypothetical protein PR202_ga18074 [Eleusine coracana subsp. coracana]
MDYDFRGRSGSGSYGAPPGAAAGGGPALYPRVGQPSHGGVGSTGSPRAPPYNHGPPSSGSSAPIATPLAPTSSSSSSNYLFSLLIICLLVRPASSGDPVVDKYVAMGLGREAVKEFVKSYNILHEMGFTSPNVPELLAIHDNDPDKVIQRLLSSPS